MATIKENINSVTHNTEQLIKDYFKLFAINQTEKIALFLGIISSVFIISILLFIVLIFCSIALANYLNTLFDNPFWGYCIVASIYLLTAIFLVVRAVKTQTPLLTNLFIKLLSFVLNLDTNNNTTIKDLRKEKESINYKIDADKANIKADVKMMKYSIMETFIKEIFNVFKQKNRSTTQASEKEKNPGSNDTGFDK